MSRWPSDPTRFHLVGSLLAWALALTFWTYALVYAILLLLR